MKEKRNYKRFELVPFLAILGCGAMLLFECIFIFELYNRAPSQVLDLTPAQPVAPVPAANPPTVEAPAVTPVSPARREFVEPANAPPAETDKATDHREPARREPVEPVESVDPVAVPVG